MVFDDILKLPASPAEFMKQKQALRARAMKNRLRSNSYAHIAGHSVKKSPLVKRKPSTPPRTTHANENKHNNNSPSHQIPKASTLILNYNKRQEEFEKEKEKTDQFFKNKTTFGPTKKSTNVVTSPDTRSPLTSITNTCPRSPVSSPVHTPQKSIATETGSPFRSPITIFKDTMDHIEERESLRNEFSELKSSLERVKSNMKNEFEQRMRSTVRNELDKQHKKLKTKFDKKLRKKQAHFTKQQSKLISELEEVKRTLAERNADTELSANNAAEKREREIRKEMEEQRAHFESTIRSIQEEHDREMSILEEKIEELLVSLQHAQASEQDALEKLEDKDGKLSAMRNKHQKFVDEVRHQISEIQDDIRAEKTKWQEEKLAFEETIAQKEKLIELLHCEKSTFESDLLTVRHNQQQLREQLKTAQSPRSQPDGQMMTPKKGKGKPGIVLTPGLRLQRLKQDLNNTSQILTNSPTASRIRDILSPKALRRKSLKPLRKNKNGIEGDDNAAIPQIPTESLVERMLRLNSADDAEVLSPGRSTGDEPVNFDAVMQEVELSPSSTIPVRKGHRRSKSMSKLARMMKTKKRTARVIRDSSTPTEKAVVDGSINDKPSKSKKRSYELVDAPIEIEEESTKRPTPTHKRFKTIF